MSGLSFPLSCHRTRNHNTTGQLTTRTQEFGDTVFSQCHCYNWWFRSMSTKVFTSIMLFWERFSCLSSRSMCRLCTLLDSRSHQLCSYQNSCWNNQELCLGKSSNLGGTIPMPISVLPCSLLLYRRWLSTKRFHFLWPIPKLWRFRTQFKCRQFRKRN